MPIFEYTTQLTATPAQVFEFLVHPENLPRVAPPSPRMELVESPQRLSLGARFTVRVRKFGISQLVISEVTAFDEGQRYTDRQIQGPLRKWIHTHSVEPIDSGTLMRDHIEYESPGGLLGLILTNNRMRRELEEMFAHRTRMFQQLIVR